MINYLLVPGLGNSGPDHWQTHFEKSDPAFHRIIQQEWNAPVCSDWISNIDKAVASFDPATVVLIGHSLGCSAIVHWACTYGKIIKGAMLVAPSDLESPLYTFQVTGFAPIPLEKINFKTIIVTSSDDYWVSLDRAAFFADHWGSEMIIISNAGHINTGSGFGEWPNGLNLLKQFE